MKILGMGMELKGSVANFDLPRSRQLFNGTLLRHNMDLSLLSLVGTIEIDTCYKFF